MDFPINDLMDENACYQFLIDIFYPQGLHCPRCQTQEGLQIQNYYREPILNYRCTQCRRVFNAWTGTGSSVLKCEAWDFSLFCRSQSFC